MASFDSIKIVENGNILIMRMQSGSKMQNVFNPKFAKEFISALDYIESLKGPKCLILTGTNKFFSAGVDLKYINNDLSNKEGKFISNMLSKIMKRLLLFNMPTIAAINGHTFGGGMFIAMCCDFRLMKADCGKLCIPAVKLGISLPIAWHKIIRTKWTSKTLRTALLTGKHWASKDALNGAIVDGEIECNKNQEFIAKCIRFAEQTKLIEIAKHRMNYAVMKKDLYDDAVDELDKHIGIAKI